jgi:hypothetical protein
MPPPPRCRAIDTIPVPAMATYYAQRATDGGLMIAEVGGGGGWGLGAGGRGRGAGDGGKRGGGAARAAVWLLGASARPGTRPRPDCVAPPSLPHT